MILRTRESGQTLPLVAIALVVLLGFAGLSTDIGYLRYQQRLQQTAADSAALAGANELVALTGSGSTTAAVTAARNDASSNGYTDNASSSGCTATPPAAGCTSVTVNIGPSSGPYAGNPQAVEVLVTVQQPRFFSGIFGAAPLPVTTRAVAIVTADDSSCFYNLTQSNPTNFSNVTVNAPGCTYVFNNNTVNFNNSTLNVAGVDCSGSCNNLSSPAVTQSAPATDPCPHIPGCAYLTNMTPSMPTGGTNVSMKSGGVMNPGTYNNVNLGGNVTFNPGLYIINGNFTANGAALTGSGVTFYIAGSGSMDVHQTTSINLSACTDCSLPPAGTLPPTGTGVNDILMYQAAPGPNSMTFNQNGSVSLTGVLYFPNQKLTMNQTSGGYTVVIAARGNFTQDTQSGFPGSGQSYIREAVLGE